MQYKQLADGMCKHIHVQMISMVFRELIAVTLHFIWMQFKL